MRRGPSHGSEHNEGLICLRSRLEAPRRHIGQPYALLEGPLPHRPCANNRPIIGHLNQPLCLKDLPTGGLVTETSLCLIGAQTHTTCHILFYILLYRFIFPTAKTKALLCNGRNLEQFYYDELTVLSTLKHIFFTYTTKRVIKIERERVFFNV